MNATGAQDPRNVVFKLSIHKDIPANTLPEPRPFSRPGDLLWEQHFQPGQFTAAPYAQLPPTGPGEWFFDPNLNAAIGEDRVVWQYNFTNFPNLFPQQEGTIYWLDVQAIALGPNGLEDPSRTFGWKTTNPLQTPHFQDDAVFGDTVGFGGGSIDPPGWMPLVYPANHPFAGQSIDMAFVITPEPGTIAMHRWRGLDGTGPARPSAGGRRSRLKWRAPGVGPGMAYSRPVHGRIEARRDCEGHGRIETRRVCEGHRCIEARLASEERARRLSSLARRASIARRTWMHRPWMFRTEAAARLLPYLHRELRIVPVEIRQVVHAPAQRVSSNDRSVASNPRS